MNSEAQATVLATHSPAHITVEPSGKAFDTLAGETILAAAIRLGVGLPYGCKDGACGSCKCKLISGQVVHGEHQTKALSPAEAAAGMVLTCCAQPVGDVVLEARQVTAEDAFPIKRIPVRIASLEKLSPDVMRLQLQLPANDTLRYHPGQYIEFLLRDGARRAYSMATAPHMVGTPAMVDLHIRHMPGGVFTDHVFASMKIKDILRAEGPFGSFYLREDSTAPIVMLASGTGFAPIKALLEHLQHINSTRPVAFYWGGRRPHDLYMHDWVLAQLQHMPQLQYIPVVSDAQPQDQWQGRTGFVHQAVLDDFADLSTFEVYACGAPIVVESAKKAYTELRDLPETSFFADAFISLADQQNTIGAL